MTEEDRKASTNPVIIMVDEYSGERYARAIGNKGTGDIRGHEWVVKDMAMELRSWGHTGGDHGHLIIKSDAEHALVAIVNSKGAQAKKKGDLLYDPLKLQDDLYSIRSESIYPGDSPSE